MQTHDKKNHSPYLKFILMMFVSFLMMYGIMFLNVFASDHIYLSTMRTYMTLLMVAPMAVSMLLFMWKMYPNKKLNFAIIGGALFVFAMSLYGVRTQSPISDIQWMKAMIPHHSSAILTSNYASIEDPEVKQLASDIIKAQEEEIAQMKAMLERLQKN